jgi:hypothetical protein
LDIHRVSEVRQIEIHTAELLVLDPTPLEVEICYCKVEKVQSSRSNQLMADLIATWLPEKDEKSNRS